MIMKKLILLIAIIFIICPQIIKEETYSWSKILERVEDFFVVNNIEILKTEENIDIIDKNKIDKDKEEKEMKTQTTLKDSIIIMNVPFISQAPLGNWSDPREQDGCEEAGVIMAMAWVSDRSDIDPLVAQNEIIALADWQQEKYGEHRDVYIKDVKTRLFLEYFTYEKVEIREVADKGEIINALNNGQIILAPCNGQALKNPHFTSPGPERHLLVIIGYDSVNDEFITNDPGTSFGSSYRYDSNLLFNAIRAYPGGYHQSIEAQEKILLFVSS